MKQLSAKSGLAIAISTVWFVICFVAAINIAGGVTGVFLLKDFILTLCLRGVLPLFVFWAIWWIVKGFKSKKFDKAKDQKVDMDSVTKELRDLEAKVEKMKAEYPRRGKWF